MISTNQACASLWPTPGLKTNYIFTDPCIQDGTTILNVTMITMNIMMTCTLYSNGYNEEGPLNRQQTTEFSTANQVVQKNTESNCTHM